MPKRSIDRLCGFCGKTIAAGEGAFRRGAIFLHVACEKRVTEKPLSRRPR
jgi:hypothetical protein